MEVFERESGSVDGVWVVFGCVWKMEVESKIGIYILACLRSFAI